MAETVRQEHDRLVKRNAELLERTNDLLKQEPRPTAALADHAEDLAQHREDLDHLRERTADEKKA